MFESKGHLSSAGIYKPYVPHTSHWSRITGFCPVYGNIGKSSRKKLRITGILAKLSQKCSKLGLFVEFYNFLHENVPNFTFFPVKFPYFTIFFGVFVKFYYFSPRKRPEFYFFSRKSPVFHYFCWSCISKTLSVRGMGSCGALIIAHFCMCVEEPEEGLS